MSVAKASRYPTPAAASSVLTEVAARNYCEHDGVPARCPSCRAVAPPPDVPDTPEPAAPRPPRRHAARHRKDDPGSSPGQLW